MTQIRFSEIEEQKNYAPLAIGKSQHYYYVSNKPHRVAKTKSTQFPNVENVNKF